MRSLVFDIETDDLKATKVWCIVAQDLESNELFRFATHQLESGLELLKSADKLIGHNILGFDIPVIKRVLGVDLSDKILIDTLVLSRLFNPVREGGHSLAMWGYRLKYPKDNFEEFETYSPKMLNYCLKDLKTKGLIKMKNFEKNPNKINYIYVLTPRGIAEKTKLTVNFMKRKMKEYDELKKEIKG